VGWMGRNFKLKPGRDDAGGMVCRAGRAPSLGGAGVIDGGVPYGPMAMYVCPYVCMYL